MVKLDLQVISIIFFTWAIVSFVLALTQDNPKTLEAGIIRGFFILILAGYLFFTSKNVIILTRNDADEN